MIWKWGSCLLCLLILSGSEWVDPEDPTVIAETELLGAAASIEAAAKKLEQLKPRAKPKVSFHPSINFLNPNTHTHTHCSDQPANSYVRSVPPKAAGSFHSCFVFGGEGGDDIFVILGLQDFRMWCFCIFMVFGKFVHICVALSLFFCGHIFFHLVR